MLNSAFMITFCPAFAYPFVRLCLNFFAPITCQASTRFGTLHHYKIVCMILQKKVRKSEDLQVSLRIFLRVNLHLCAKT